MSVGLLFIDQSKGRRDRLVPVGRRALGWVARYSPEVRLDTPGAMSTNTSSEPQEREPQHEGAGAGRFRRHCGEQAAPRSSRRACGAPPQLESGMDVSYIQRLSVTSFDPHHVVYLRVSERALQSRLAESHPCGGRNANHGGQGGVHHEIRQRLARLRGIHAEFLVPFATEPWRPTRCRSGCCVRGGALPLPSFDPGCEPRRPDGRLSGFPRARTGRTGVSAAGQPDAGREGQGRPRFFAFRARGHSALRDPTAQMVRPREQVLS